MSFSSDVKRELPALPIGSRDFMLAELAAILENSAEIRLKPSGIRVITENSMAIARVEALMKSIFNVTMEVRGRFGLHGSHIRTYELVFQDRDCVLDVLQEVGFLSADDDGAELVRVPDPALLETSEGRRAFLRGAFLGSGFIADPYKKYHLEFAGRTEAYAGRLLTVLGEEGISARYLERRRGTARSTWVLYLKDGSDIVDLLNMIGAHGSLLRMEEIRVEKEVRNAINRKCNCDNANSQKTVSAAVRVTEDILYLQRRGHFDLLSPALKEVALARLEDPEAPLAELGRMLDTPLGKSGVNHRLNKISEIAAELRDHEPEI